jgi:hypothetical protein
MSDAVGIGLFAGAVGGILIILGGAVYAAARDKLPNGELGDYSFKYFTYGNGVFWWLLLLTGAVVGLFVYVKFLSDYFSELPKQQSNVATVS